MLMDLLDIEGGRTSVPEHMVFLNKLIECALKIKNEALEEYVFRSSSYLDDTDKHFYVSDLNEKGVLLEQASFLLKEAEVPKYTVYIDVQKSGTPSKSNAKSFFSNRQDTAGVCLRYSPIYRTITLSCNDLEDIIFYMPTYTKDKIQQQCIFNFMKLYRIIHKQEKKKDLLQDISRTIDETLKIFPDLQNAMLLDGEDSE
jgi:hypothetical protein